MDNCDSSSSSSSSLVVEVILWLCLCTASFCMPLRDSSKIPMQIQQQAHSATAINFLHC